MYKKTTLSALGLLTLAACGGGSGGSSSSGDIVEEPTPVPTTEAISVKVIDGYLSNAEVCVISTGESNCQVVGVTDEQGQITLPDSFSAGTVQATITAGQTKDQDSVGFVGNSYQLVAEINGDTEKVVTPFTTLDYLDLSKTMADIAAELALDEATLKGDYVSDESNDAGHAHAIARSLTRVLSASLDDNEASSLSSYAVQVSDYINAELINSGTDLDTVNIVINDGQVSHVKAITSLEDYLDGDLHMFSTNFDAYSREGIQTVTFDQGQVSMNGGVPISYTIDGDTVNFGGEGDVFLYVSADLALQVPIADEDLIVTSPHSIQNALDWSTSDFSDNTFYFLNDDSFCDADYCSPSELEPDPTLNEITFSATEATVVENGESMSFPWRIENGNLILELTAVGNKRDIVFSPSVTDGNITVAKDIGYGRAPSLIFKDKALAESIHYSWLKI